jgi:ABC-type uncharacterized transport system permease subunit
MHNSYSEFHIILSLTTVLVLTIAGLLALLLALQERFLRNGNLGIWAQKLPPLQTMESCLFLVTRWGFFLLTALLCFSFYCYHSLLWRYPILLPKILMALIAWVIFLALLLGRRWWGWRGARAINAILLGVVLLIIVSLASHFGLL